MYKCTVYDSENKRKVIKLNLESKEKINEYAACNKVRIVDVKKVRNSKKNKKIKDKDIKIFCNEIGILLESGCEVTKLFNILKKQSNKNMENILQKIYIDIEKGNSITEAFQNTKQFSQFFISMINAGEISGNLDEVMNNLSSYYDKENKLKTKIMTMLIYPIILIVLSVLAMLFILINIIPNFNTIFVNNGINPPLLTKILINISTFIRSKFIYVVPIFLMSIPLVTYIFKQNVRLKNKINILKLKIPIIKDFTKLIITARFSRSIYILLRSGIHIIDAINISAKVIDNDLAYERISISNEYIKRGNSIAEALKVSDIFPNLFLSMINIGEESGKIDKCLKTTNEFYENELDTRIDQMMKVIEPLIIIFIGGFIGMFVIAMLLPMFDAVVSI